MSYIKQKERKAIETYLKSLLDIIESKENNNNAIQAILCDFMKFDIEWLLTEQSLFFYNTVKNYVKI